MVVYKNTFGGRNNAQGHIVIFNLGGCFSLEDWRWLHRLMVFYWNDVEIQVTCETPDIPVSKCGVYVYRQQINMENIQFQCPTMLSMNNAPTTSPEQRAKASRPNERPYKKFLRKLKVVDKGKRDKTKKASSNQSAPHPAVKVFLQMS
ncbi:hypothetical protein K1719_031873 [Acacia pycnantha]|nr:hypothetical protein K1719_031873 [Acacia pycnantha]